MTAEGCHDMRLLIQADLDGELQAADSARVAAHLQHCAACSDLQAQLLELSARLREELPRHPASSRLRSAIGKAVAPKRASSIPRGAYAGAGLAMAASLALFLLLPAGNAIPDSVVTAHIRALQPGHLMDVVSTDQHTVKPWFDGKLPFAPPVRDLAAAGFPLIGGRLDHLAGQNAAALIYKRRQHIIELFVWETPRWQSQATGSEDGYNFVHWSAGGMSLWAVSDLNAAELADFVAKWRGG